MGCRSDNFLGLQVSVLSTSSLCHAIVPVAGLAACMSNGNDRSAAINNCGDDRVGKTQYREATHVAFATESMHLDAALREPSRPVHASANCRHEQLTVVRSFTLVPGRRRLELFGGTRLEW